MIISNLRERYDPKVKGKEDRNVDVAVKRYYNSRFKNYDSKEVIDPKADPVDTLQKIMKEKGITIVTDPASGEARQYNIDIDNPLLMRKLMPIEFI